MLQGKTEFVLLHALDLEITDVQMVRPPLFLLFRHVLPNNLSFKLA